MKKIGHLAVEKTQEKIHRHYWFPDMKKKIESFIRNCIKCITYAAPVRTAERRLYCIKKEPVPFDTIHMDHFGPLPTVTSKRKHILSIVDGFSKHNKLFSVLSTSTQEVLRCMEKYFDFFDRPRRVITDQATCFTSLEFAAKMKEWNIEHVKIAVGSPQANGQVERVNRTMKAMLGKITEPVDHADWAQKLAQVEYALNNTKHSTTGFSPCELLFGVNQRGRVPDELTEYLDNQYHSEPARDLNAIRSVAAGAIAQKQAYSEQRAAESSVPVREYEVGDFVVITNVDVSVGKNKKLIPKYRGPYEVYKVIGHDRYAIRDVNNCQLTQRPYDNVVEAARMRPWAEKLNASIESVSSVSKCGTSFSSIGPIEVVRMDEL